MRIQNYDKTRGACTMTLTLTITLWNLQFTDLPRTIEGSLKHVIP